MPLPSVRARQYFRPPPPNPHHPLFTIRGMMHFRSCQRCAAPEPGDPDDAFTCIDCQRDRCIDGHKARSRDERVIDDWLWSNGILHEREPKLKGMRPDWRVGDVYVEYWGMAGQQGYEARREEKLALYKRRRLKLVELFPEDVSCLEHKLGFLRGVNAPRLF